MQVCMKYSVHPHYPLYVSWIPLTIQGEVCIRIIVSAEIYISVEIITRPAPGENLQVKMHY